MYCTSDDIKKQIPAETVLQLTDDDNLGTIEETRVDEAIANAAAVIDGYCTGRYVLPFNPVPAIIKPIAVDLAIYNLYARRVEVMPEVRAANQKNALKLLADISSGKIRLGDATGVEVPVSSQQSPVVTSNERLFSRTSMKGL